MKISFWGDSSDRVFRSVLVSVDNIGHIVSNNTKGVTVA